MKLLNKYCYTVGEVLDHVSLNRRRRVVGIEVLDGIVWYLVVAEGYEDCSYTYRFCEEYLKLNYRRIK